MISPRAFVLSVSLMWLAAINTSAQKPTLYVQKGHVGAIYAIAYSLDGRTLASAGEDKTVKLWDVTTRREIRTLAGHDGAVTGVAISRDGRLLASCGADGRLMVWDIATGQKVWGYRQTPPFLATAFSPDGRYVAAWGRDLTLWDAKTGQEAKRIKGDANINMIASTFGTSSVHVPFAFSPDSLKIFSLSEGRPKSFEIATGKKLRTFNEYLFSSIAVSPDGGVLVLGQSDFEVINREPFRGRNFGSIAAFDTAKGKLIKKWEAHPGRGTFGDVTSLAFSPDGKTLASTGADRTTKLWDTSTWREVKTLEGHQDDINAVAFSPDGSTLATATGSSSVGGTESSITLWSSRTGERLATFGRQSSRAYGVAVSTDGKRLAHLETDTRRSVIGVWDLAKGQKTRTFEFPLWFFSIAFSPDGKTLLTAGRDGTARLWDADTGLPVQTIQVHRDSIFCASFSPDGRRVATAGTDKAIKTWEVGSGRQLQTFAGHRDYVLHIAFSPDGSLLASVSHDKTIRLWDADTGRQLKSLIDPASDLKIKEIPPQAKLLGIIQTGEMWAGGVVAFSPDGRTLAASVGGYAMARVGNEEKVAKVADDIRLYDVASGAEKSRLVGHQGALQSLSFSSDGRRLASGSADKTVEVWDVNTGRRMLTPGAPLDMDTYAAFVPNKQLVAGVSRGLTHLWDTTSGELLATMTSVESTNEWLVATPDGLFDGSPTAWQLLLWRFSQHTADVLPVEAYFSDFFYPNLLVDIYAGERPRSQSQIEYKDRRQPALKISLPDVVGGLATSRAVKVRIEVEEAPPSGAQSAGSGARDVRLFRNGSLVKAWRGDVLSGSGSRIILEVSVPIVAGENVITAYAFNRDNVKSLDATAKVVGAEALRRQGMLYILAVGVNIYGNPQFNLKYAVPDAQDFGEEFRRQQSRLKYFAGVEVIPLLDKNATKGNIMLALKRLAGGDEVLPEGVPDEIRKIRLAQPEDAVVIFFSGHGTARQNQFYLIPHDLGYAGPRTRVDSNVLQNILARSISDRELQAIFEQIDVGQMMLVIDACNSGQALEAEEKRRGPMNSRGLAQLAYEKGMYILTAAQSYQVALETSQLGHGYLTYALVEEGLKTARADLEPPDGQVTARELLNFVTDRVPQIQQQLPRINPVPVGQPHAKPTVSPSARGRGRRQRKPAQSQRDLVQEDTPIASPSSPERQQIQMPRVFYRREVEHRPLIVARP
jgi:WD40 repeat protein